MRASTATYEPKHGPGGNAGSAQRQPCSKQCSEGRIRPRSRHVWDALAGGGLLVRAWLTIARSPCDHRHDQVDQRGNPFDRG